MKRHHRESLTGLAFLLPFFIGFALFHLIPFGISIGYTFTFGIGGTDFVGLSNYRSVLGSSAFRRAAGNTARFIVVGVPILLILSLTLAIALQKKTVSNVMFRRAFLIPMFLPIASTVTFFRLFFADNGLLNGLRLSAGQSAVLWIHSSNAFGVIVLLYVWKNCGYIVILMLSGLAAITPQVYEAADMEGASGFQRFRLITLPLLAPTLFFSFVLCIVNGFKNFREAFLLAGTHPDMSIYMLQHYMNNNFYNLNYQRLSVSALLVFLFIFALVLCLYIVRMRTDTWEM